MLMQMKKKIVNNQKPLIDETAKIEKLAKEFIALEKPTKQLLNELIEKIMEIGGV